MIIKEYFEGETAFVIVIRESSYGSKFDKFERLFSIAKRDFPNLNSQDVEVVHFAGKYYARTFGIEFESDIIPSEEYKRILSLEHRL